MGGVVIYLFIYFWMKSHTNTSIVPQLRPVHHLAFRSQNYHQPLKDERNKYSFSRQDNIKLMAFYHGNKRF